MFTLYHVQCSSLLVIADLYINSLGFFEIRFATFAFFIFFTVMSIVTHVNVVAIKTYLLTKYLLTCTYVIETVMKLYQYMYSVLFLSANCTDELYLQMLLSLWLICHQHVSQDQQFDRSGLRVTNMCDRINTLIT